MVAIKTNKNACEASDVKHEYELNKNLSYKCMLSQTTHRRCTGLKGCALQGCTAGAHVKGAHGRTAGARGAHDNRAHGCTAGARTTTQQGHAHARGRDAQGARQGCAGRVAGTRRVRGKGAT